MSDATDLDQATTMIEKAWGLPLDELEVLAVQQPVRDPLLRSTMHIRSGLVISSNAVAVHQERLHAMTRPGRVPAFYDQDRVTRSAAELRVAQAESRTALQAISSVIDAREAARSADPDPAIRLAEAAVARSAHATRPPGQLPSPPPGPAATGPAVAATGPHR